MDLCHDLLSRPVSWPAGWLFGTGLCSQPPRFHPHTGRRNKNGKSFSSGRPAMNNCAAGWGGAAAADGGNSEDDGF